VVDAELHLEALGGPALGAHHDAGVVDQQVEPLVVAGEVARERTHLLEIGEVELADLNILDAIWINAHPNGGPSTDYSEATRRDELIVSIDPVAADLWATENILIPAFEDNGYTDWPKADPQDPNSDFREYLDNSANAILAAGIEVTANPDYIDAFSLRIPILADGFESGDTSAWSNALP